VPVGPAAASTASGSAVVMGDKRASSSGLDLQKQAKRRHLDQAMDWEGADVAAAPAQAATLAGSTSEAAVGVGGGTAAGGGRGSHSFTFQLNLSRFRHQLADFTQAYPTETCVTLSRKVDECKPLVGGLTAFGGTPTGAAAGPSAGSAGAGPSAGAAAGPSAGAAAGPSAGSVQ